jgi:hypothetical protein
MEVEGAGPTGEAAAAAASSADARAVACQIMQLGDQAKGCLDRCCKPLFYHDSHQTRFRVRPPSFLRLADLR